MGNYFSKNLKFLREKNNMSQNKLAKLIGVNQTTIARWEDNNRTPTVDNAYDVCKIFNIPLSEFLGKDLKSLNQTKEEEEIKEIEALKRVLKKAGFMKDNEDLTDDELKKLLNFILANKDFLKKGKE